MVSQSSIQVKLICSGVYWVPLISQLACRGSTWTWILRKILLENACSATPYITTQNRNSSFIKQHGLHWGASYYTESKYTSLKLHLYQWITESPLIRYHNIFNGNEQISLKLPLIKCSPMFISFSNFIYLCFKISHQRPLGNINIKG